MPDFAAHFAYNPIGKIPAQLAAPSFADYPLRAFDAAALQRLERLGYKIPRQQVRAADIAAFMNRHPQWATHPGDGCPFRWDPQPQQLAVQRLGRQPAGQGLGIPVWEAAPRS